MVEAAEAKAAEAPEAKPSGGEQATAYGLAADLPDGTQVLSRAGEHEPDRVEGGWFTDEDSVSLDDLRSEEGEPSEKSSEKEKAASSPSKEEEGKGAKPEADKGKEDEAKAKEKEEAKASEDGKEGEKKSDEEAKAKEKEETSKKPPKGFVPEAALYEERGKRQRLSQELSELRQKVTELESKPPEKPTRASAEEEKRAAAAADKASDLTKTFTQEAAELEKIDPEENPLEFQKKTFSLLKNLPSLLEATKNSVEQGYKTEFEERETSAREQAEFQDAVESGVRLMSHLVPGVRDPETNKALTEFAVKEGGVPIEALRDLTNPGTIIMSPDGEPRYLKDEAAYLVSFINKMHQSQSAPDLDSMEVNDIIAKRGDDIKAVLLEEVKQEAYNQAVKDLRSKGLGKEDEGFKPIGELPGSDASESGIDSDHLYSEAEVSRMSSKQMAEWLQE